MNISVRSPNNTVCVCIVDDEDYDIIAGYKWRIDSRGYVITSVKKRTLGIHRLITHAKRGDIVDHINRNKLDNRKANLRITDDTTSNLNRDNYRSNRSGHRGVGWEARIKRWRAFGSKSGKVKYLGVHDSYDEAVMAYHSFILETHTNLYCCQ